MKLVRENNPKCNATNRCDNPGRYKLMVEDVGGWSLCTEHAKELCSLEMPKGPKFIVSQHRYPGVPYCRHGTKESVVFRVTTEVEHSGRNALRRLCPCNSQNAWSQTIAELFCYHV